MFRLNISARYRCTRTGKFGSAAPPARESERVSYVWQENILRERLAKGLQIVELKLSQLLRTPDFRSIGFTKEAQTPPLRLTGQGCLPSAKGIVALVCSRH